VIASLPHWLTGGDSGLQWLMRELIGTAISVTCGTLILLPILQRIVRWTRQMFDPYTPGGLGDLPDEAGVPAHVRLAQAAPVPTKGESSV
jgi:hypothetical protein